MKDENEWKVKVAISDIKLIKNKLESHSEYIQDFAKRIDDDLLMLDKLLFFLKKPNETPTKCNTTQDSET